MEDLRSLTPLTFGPCEVPDGNSNSKPTAHNESTYNGDLANRNRLLKGLENAFKSTFGAYVFRAITFGHFVCKK